MMKFLMDTHTHTIASGHAYSTVDENMRFAAEKGLELVALTDHAPGMKDTTCHAYFANLHVLPERLHGVRLLRGIELNIMDYDGKVDMDEKILSRLDMAIASLHMNCLQPGSKKENTRACIKAMENPFVRILGHPGDPHYEMDYRELFRAAKETNTLLEVNRVSLIPGSLRAGSEENMEKLLRMCMEEEYPVVLGSDAHFYDRVGDFDIVVPFLERLRFPEELVLNTDPEKFLSWLKKR